MWVISFSEATPDDIINDAHIPAVHYWTPYSQHTKIENYVFPFFIKFAAIFKSSLSFYQVLWCTKSCLTEVNTVSSEPTIDEANELLCSTKDSFTHFY